MAVRNYYIILSANTLRKYAHGKHGPHVRWNLKAFNSCRRESHLVSKRLFKHSDLISWVISNGFVACVASPEKMKVHLVRTSSESSVLMISNHSEHACLLMETMKTCASTQRISLTNALILLSEKSTRLEQETMSTEWTWTWKLSLVYPSVSTRDFKAVLHF